ncbi:MAG: nucleotidyltransferase family protein, partial [Bdellovibrionales bacterium]|nr:nucleotidyltransferase family protein [Bdellovibrionales bacterium]
LLLSAGFGTRLRPLTECLPKPLIRIGDKTLIERNLELLARAGISRVFINLHYLGDQIRQFVGDGSRWGMTVEYAEEPTLLDTGGAIRNIEKRLAHEQLLTVNSDILVQPDFPLHAVLEQHVDAAVRPAMTMVVRHDEDHAKYGTIGIDETGRVVSFLGKAYGGRVARELMYTGIQVMERRIIREVMPPEGEIFSLTQGTVRDLLQLGAYVDSYVYDGYWSDIGTPERLDAASKVVASKFACSGHDSTRDN